MAQRFMLMSLAVSRLEREMRRLKKEGMETFGLKGEQTMLLVILYSREEGMQFQELCTLLEADPGLVSCNLKKLTQDGYILRRGEPGRYKAVYELSEKGKETAAKMMPLIDEMEQAARTGITQEELDGFYQTAAKLCANLRTATLDGGNE